MSIVRIFVRSQSHQPLGASVKCVYTDRRETGYLPTAVENEGTLNVFTYFDVHEAENIDFVLVWPNGGHWRTVMTDLKSDDTCFCNKINAKDLNWWRESLRLPSDRSAEGIKIGVIDINNRLVENNSLISYVKHYAHGDPCDEGHGSRVSGIIAEEQRPNKAETSICKGAEIVFYDTAPPLARQLKHEKYPVAAMANGIYHLAFEEKVDLICISGGTTSEDGAKTLEKAVDRAYDRGTLVLSAVGNSANEPCAAPAKFHNAIGVSGLGFEPAYPENSYANLVASRRLKNYDLPINGEHGWFISPHAPTGPGVDIYAPSIGIPLTFSSGTDIDVEGTSYSCPMVVGVLALHLSKDEDYRRLSGSARSDYARHCVSKIEAGVVKNDIKNGGLTPGLVSND